MDGNSGEICSPGYPEYFSGSVQCTWKITALKRHIIHLEFEFFDVGHAKSCSSEVDQSFVQVRDGGVDGPSVGIYCGPSKPPRLSSFGQQLWVRFKANKYRSTKFRATFTTEKGKKVVPLFH